MTAAQAASSVVAVAHGAVLVAVEGVVLLLLAEALQLLPLLGQFVRRRLHQALPPQASWIHYGLAKLVVLVSLVGYFLDEVAVCAA